MLIEELYFKDEVLKIKFDNGETAELMNFKGRVVISATKKVKTNELSEIKKIAQKNWNKIELLTPFKSVFFTEIWIG